MDVALVGGSSRAAKAFIHFAGAACQGFRFRQIVRDKPGRSIDQAVRVVDDYRSVRAADFADCDAAIHFVGSPNLTDRDELFEVNRDSAMAAALAARDAGVTNFIFLSSLSMFGRQAWIGEETAVAPLTGYGEAKASAENELSKLQTADFAVTLLRIPAIYGARAPSKIASLVRLMRIARFLPVGAHVPRRSVLGHENLCRVLVSLLTDPTSGIVYAADPEPMTLEMLADVTGARLLRVPDLSLSPVRLVSPGLYHSLYEDMVIDPALLYRPNQSQLVSTIRSLQSAFG